MMHVLDAVLWKRKVFYTAGLLLALSIRTIDPMAAWGDDFLYINMAAACAFA